MKLNVTGSSQFFHENYIVYHIIMSYDQCMGITKIMDFLFLYFMHFVKDFHCMWCNLGYVHTITCCNHNQCIWSAFQLSSQWKHTFREPLKWLGTAAIVIFKWNSVKCSECFNISFPVLSPLTDWDPPTQNARSFLAYSRCFLLGFICMQPCILLIKKKIRIHAQ